MIQILKHSSNKCYATFWKQWNNVRLWLNKLFMGLQKILLLHQNNLFYYNFLGIDCYPIDAVSAPICRLGSLKLQTSWHSYVSIVVCKACFAKAFFTSIGAIEVELCCEESLPDLPELPIAHIVILYQHSPALLLEKNDCEVIKFPFQYGSWTKKKVVQKMCSDKKRVVQVSRGLMGSKSNFSNEPHAVRIVHSH